MTGLSDRAQAVLVLIADILLAIGTIDTTASIIQHAPYVQLGLGIAAAVGGAILRFAKENAGSQPVGN